MSYRVLGGGKGGQTLDIVSCAKFALELGRDSYDKAAVAQMDVATHHDSFDRASLLLSLQRRAVSHQWRLAALRMQRCARVCLQVRGEDTPVLPRQRGALTGSMLAPLFGRIMMEDVFTMADPLIHGQVFQLCGITLWPMAWSDNVVAFANSTRRAANILLPSKRCCTMWAISKLKTAQQRFYLRAAGTSIGVQFELTACIAMWSQASSVLASL